MTFGNFRLNVIVRLLLVAATICILVYTIFQTTWVVTPFVLILITCFALAELFRYIDRANNEFADFLQSIRNSDFSRYTEDDTRGTSFTQLKHAYNSIINEFQAARIDKEAQYTFLQKVLDNINTAIVSFDDNGDIRLFNKAAELLLELPFLNNIKQLQKINPELYQQLTAGTNEITTVHIREKEQKLLLRSASFSLQGSKYTIVFITNVKPEIDRTEIESWEQLLQVLTHEIMNSITPISSLSGSIRHHLDDIVTESKLDAELFGDMMEGLQVIEKRSAGLVRFVNNYKTLLTLPEPDFKKINTEQLFSRIRLLTIPKLSANNVQFKIELKSTLLYIVADEHMLEQVLLNLVYNAADAVANTIDPIIELTADIDAEKTVIKVSDNGMGIDPELASKIFVPFFTTKNDGTGIGLSLAKQIMRRHEGAIHMQSAPGKGTTFTLSFP